MTGLPHISPERWLVIVNPNAGIRRGGKDWPHISRLLNEKQVDHLGVITEHRDHANRIAMDFIGEGYRRIVVVGGDGTMNEVVNGIFLQNAVPPSDITLGMIPVGTGNDWCRTFGIPFEYEKAVDLLCKGTTFLQDVGKIRYFRKDQHQTHFFMNIAGMGYDALVAKMTNQVKEKGRGGPLTYLFFVFAGLFQYKFIEAVVEVDGNQVFKDDFFSMNVGICKFNGGGMKQVPFAVPDDGLLDVTLIKKASKWIVVRHARKLYDGSHVELPIVSTFRGATVRIRSTGRIFLEADGESLGHSPFTFEILPRSLKVIVGEMNGA